MCRPPLRHPSNTGATQCPRISPRVAHICPLLACVGTSTQLINQPAFEPSRISPQVAHICRLLACVGTSTQFINHVLRLKAPPIIGIQSRGRNYSHDATHSPLPPCSYRPRLCPIPPRPRA